MNWSHYPKKYFDQLMKLIIKCVTVMTLDASCVVSNTEFEKSCDCQILFYFLNFCKYKFYAHTEYSVFTL